MTPNLIKGPPRKFTVDTNLFIDGFRDPAANIALQSFHQYASPQEYLSGIVVHELLAGVRSARDRVALEKYIVDPFRKRARLFSPTTAAWLKAGDVLARMAIRDGVRISEVRRSFANDILLAASCREAGVTLITQNTRDFTRIRRDIPFEFVAPWP